MKAYNWARPLRTNLPNCQGKCYHLSKRKENKRDREKAFFSAIQAPSFFSFPVDRTFSKLKKSLPPPILLLNLLFVFFFGVGRLGRKYLFLFGSHTCLAGRVLIFSPSLNLPKKNKVG